MTKFAYRLETKRIKETDFPYSAVPMMNPQAVVEFAGALEDADVEKMIVLYLNTKNKLIGIKINAGTINRQVIFPREIIKEALLSSSACFVLVHNHPSGDPTASPEDVSLTRSIIEAAALFDMNVLDHIIIGADKSYFSLSEKGLMPTFAKSGQINLNLGR